MEMHNTIDSETVQAITGFLFVRHDPTAVDLAIVLGSPTVNSMYPAVSLYKACLTQRILISGAGRSVTGQPEWELYRDLAVESGIPPGALLLEKKALNTLENFEFGAELIVQSIGWEQIRTVGLCAKPFHMRRVLMTARRFFPATVHVVACPADHPTNLSASNWAETSHGRQKIFEELGKISRYALQGDFGAY